MKTFILQLEPHDDIVSVRDKMGWAKNSRILVVWPENVAMLNRRLDLELLLRHSQALGVQLALVSQDSEVRYQAPRLGIPVFKNTRKAQDQHWRVSWRFRRQAAEHFDRLRRSDAEEASPRALPERPQIEERPLSPLARLAFFTAGVLALLAIAATLAPSARLSLTPRTMVQDVLIDAFTNPNIDSVGLAGGVPSKLVFVEVEGRDAIPVSGAIRLPDQAAEGTALFTNLTDQPIAIPKGTVVRPAGDAASRRYATLVDGQVPAGPENVLELRVRDVSPGKEGNLPAGALAGIEGILGTQLGVSNPEPLTGGSDRQEPAPTSQNRLDLARKLQAALEATARQEIQDQLAPGDLFIPSSLELAETLKEVYQPEGMQPADELTLSRLLKYQARVVRHADLARLVQLVFDANMPVGFAPLPESLQIEILDEPHLTNGSDIAWKMHAIRRVQAHIDASQAVRLSLGLSPEEAAHRLQDELPLEEPPKINLLPAWWPRMPVLPFRIELISLTQSEGGAP